MIVDKRYRQTYNLHLGRSVISEGPEDADKKYTVKSETKKEMSGNKCQGITVGVDRIRLGRLYCVELVMLLMGYLLIQWLFVLVVRMWMNKRVLEG